MYGAVNFDAAAAIFRDRNNRVRRAIEIFADAVRQFVLNAGSQRFADIHLPPGDLYAHQ